MTARKDQMTDEVKVHPRIAMKVYRDLLDAVGKPPSGDRCEFVMMMADGLPPEELARLRAALEQFAHGARLRLVLPKDASQ